jgi:hypothetical protein
VTDAEYQAEKDKAAKSAEAHSARR